MTCLFLTLSRFLPMFACSSSWWTGGGRSRGRRSQSWDNSPHVSCLSLSKHLAKVLKFSPSFPFQGVLLHPDGEVRAPVPQRGPQAPRGHPGPIGHRALPSHQPPLQQEQPHWGELSYVVNPWTLNTPKERNSYWLTVERLLGDSLHQPVDIIYAEEIKIIIDKKWKFTVHLNKSVDIGYTETKKNSHF